MKFYASIEKVLKNSRIVYIVLYFRKCLWCYRNRWTKYWWYRCKTKI